MRLHKLNVRVTLRYSALLILIALGMLIYQSFHQNRETVYRSDFAMGTVLTQAARGTDTAEVMAEGAGVVSMLGQALSMNATSGFTFEVNHSKNPVPVPDGYKPYLDNIREVMEKSGGALDITMGAVTEMWGIPSGSMTVPDPVSLSAVLRRSLAGKTEISGTSVSLAAGQKIDFGAVGKGWACDVLADLYRSRGVQGMIDFGGNVMLVGSPPDNNKWKVGIQKPGGASGEVIGYLSLGGGSVVTSGIYEKYVEQNGVRYHHILDPKTGYPVNNGLVSVTISGPQSVICDALSTAVFVLGEEKGRTLMEGYPEYGALFVTDNGEIHTTDNLTYEFRWNGVTP